MLCNQIRGTDITIQQKIFNWLLISTMVILVFDSGMWIIDGMAFKNAKGLNLFLTTAYFLSEGLVPFAWPLYVEFLVNNDVKKLKRTAVYGLFPLIVYIILILFNVWNRKVFIIDNNNCYRRSTYNFIPLVLAGFYFVEATYKIYKGAKTVSDMNERNQMYYLSAFVIFPVVASVIQMLYFGTSVIWISVVISLLIIFVNVQNKQISTDSLTGLNNRIQFEKYISALIKDAKKQEQICLVVIDIDKFKIINDTFGHAEGDRALISISDILKKACKNKKIFISRYGGDEFLIIYKVKNIGQLDELISDIYFNLDAFNTREGQKYLLRLSIGRAIWDSNECHSISDLFVKADNNMYTEKKKKTN
ncbi:hypothetical protein SDC9_90187 [bioreactor metagenome]|uniref:GGDEF domain-containing protein n=1 Tax=bioreactor metagenome TaxID=1076179 RepID=A0A644ZRB7_9ZZZZ